MAGELFRVELLERAGALEADVQERVHHLVEQLRPRDDLLVA